MNQKKKSIITLLFALCKGGIERVGDFIYICVLQAKLNASIRPHSKLIPPPSPAAWLSPPAVTPWLLSAEPSSAGHPVTGLVGANLEAPCPCGCRVEGALQASCS